MTTTLDELAQAFADFRTRNDERLAQIERNGAADALTVQATNAANAAIDRLQAQLRDEHAAATSRIDEIENRMNRAQMGGRGFRLDDDTRIRWANWQSAIQGQDVDPANLDEEFCRNYTRAFRDVIRHGDGASAESKRFINEMSVQSEPDGGMWVSPDTTGRIVQLLYETSPIRQHASVQSITTDALEGTYDLDEADHGGWVGETGTRTGNTGTPQLGGWRIPVYEGYAEPRATQKLLEDAAVDVEAWLARKVTAKFQRIENTAFVTGAGVVKPRGFMTYSAGTPAAGTMASWQVVQQVVSGSGSALTTDGLIDLVYSLKSGYRSNAIFGMNRTTEREVRQLKDGQNNYIWQPDFTKRASSTLLGFPIIEMPDLADIAGNALPIVFGDLGEAYQIVDRLGITVLRDPYTTRGYVKFYTRKRVGGDVINFEAIKIQKIST